MANLIDSHIDPDSMAVRATREAGNRGLGVFQAQAFVAGARAAAAGAQSMPTMRCQSRVFDGMTWAVSVMEAHHAAARAEADATAAASVDAAHAAVRPRLIAAGFQMRDTGGGCTSWERDLPNGETLCLTDTLGCDAVPLDGDWLLGVLPEDRGDWSELGIFADLAEALAVAREYHSARRFAHRRRKADRKRFSYRLDNPASQAGFVRGEMAFQLGAARRFRLEWSQAATSLPRGEVLRRTAHRHSIHLTCARSNREAAASFLRLP